MSDRIILSRRTFLKGASALAVAAGIDPLEVAASIPEDDKRRFWNFSRFFSKRNPAPHISTTPHAPAGYAYGVYTGRGMAFGDMPFGMRDVKRYYLPAGEELRTGDIVAFDRSGKVRRARDVIAERDTLVARQPLTTQSGSERWRSRDDHSSRPSLRRQLQSAALASRCASPAQATQPREVAVSIEPDALPAGESARVTVDLDAAYDWNESLDHDDWLAVIIDYYNDYPGEKQSPG